MDSLWGLNLSKAGVDSNALRVLGDPLTVMPFKLTALTYGADVSAICCSDDISGFSLTLVTPERLTCVWQKSRRMFVAVLSETPGVKKDQDSWALFWSTIWA